MKNQVHSLRSQAVTQAVWHHYRDAQTGKEIPAIGSLRYHRFYRRVRLDEMIIQPVPVRWKAKDRRALPAEPELHAWDDSRHDWRLVLKKKLPRLPPEKFHRIKLGGIETRFVKAVCLRQHPVAPNCAEQWANPHNVPYATLSNIEWHGRALTPWKCDLPMQPPLKIANYRPRGMPGMKAFIENDQVKFSSPKFAVGFSLQRPLLSHLGWDSAGGGKSADNMLFHRTVGGSLGDLRILSGPLWNTLDWKRIVRAWLESRFPKKIGGRCFVSATAPYDDDGTPRLPSSLPLASPSRNRSFEGVSKQVLRQKGETDVEITNGGGEQSPSSV